MPVDLSTPAPDTTPLTARLAGALGQDSAEAALLVARALARAGWHVSLTTDAPAQVRGGHTFQTISAAAPGSAAVPPVAVLKPESPAASPARPKPQPKVAEQLVLNLLKELLVEGNLKINLEDELQKGCVITHDGQVVNETVKQAMDG